MVSQFSDGIQGVVAKFEAEAVVIVELHFQPGKSNLACYKT